MLRQNMRSLMRCTRRQTRTIFSQKGGKRARAKSRGTRMTKKKLACSTDNNNNFTCYSRDSLIKLRTLWNSRHPDDLIKSNDSRVIWEALKQRLSDVCDTEACWLRQRFIDEKTAKALLRYTFAPEAPPSWSKNPDEWLTSVDIERVMHQYEKRYPCFEFIGPSPIDYNEHMEYGQCVWEELCKLDIQNLVKRGKFKLGIIFNLDPHYKPGSHWVSLFVNLKRNYIFYFDSTGEPAPKQVKQLVKTITEQAAAMGIELEFIENDRAHQKQDNECGMYSLYAIASQLKDIRSPHSFLKGGEITDKSMHQLRSRYFNKHGTLTQPKDKK